MSGTKSSTTNSATSNSYDPSVIAAGQNILSNASSLPSYQGYTGPTQAAFGPTTQAATTDLTGLLASGTNPSTTQAGNIYGSVAGSIDPNASVQSYMNPYVQATLAPTLDNLNTSALQQHQANGAAATLAGDYGGTGQGVADALTNKYLGQNVANATGQAESNAYNAAIGEQSNMLSQLMNAGSGLANTGQQAFSQNTTLDSMLAALGQQQQTAGQTGINTAVNVNNQNQMAPLTQQTMLASILSALPKDTSGTGTSTTTTPDNSGMALLGSLLPGLLSTGGTTSNPGLLAGLL